MKSGTGEKIKSSVKEWFRKLPYNFAYFLLHGGWLVFVLFFLDLGTKLGLEAYYGGEETNGATLSLLWYGNGKNILGIGLVYNEGISFGKFPQLRPFFTAVSVIVGLVLVVYLSYHFERKPWHLRYALYLIIAGDFGNFIDRAFYPNGVIDWIAVGNDDWPTGLSYICNLADVFLSFGLVLLLVSLILSSIDQSKEEKEAVSRAKESKAKTGKAKDDADELKDLKDSLNNSKKGDGNDGEK